MERIGCCHKHLACQAVGRCLNESLLEDRNYDCYLRDRLTGKYKTVETFTKGPEYDIIKLTKLSNQKKEVVGMSKKHSKKSKKIERRVPVTPEEESRFLESRLRKVKEAIEQETGTEIEEQEMVLPEISKEKSRRSKEREKAKGTKASPTKNYDGPLVIIKDLADELKVEPTELRKKLRGSSIEKPSGRWEWPVGHPDLDKVRALYGKKVAPVAPVVEADDEGEEDELDYESMTKKELRALAKELGLEVEKDMSKEEIIELLEEADEAEEDEEEEEEEEEEELDYEELDIDELKQLCRDSGVKFKKGATKEDLIQLLEEYDE